LAQAQALPYHRLHVGIHQPSFIWQGEPTESDEGSAFASNFEEEDSTEVTSPDSPPVQGRRPLATAPRRGSALKSPSMRRKPQLDRIAESSGHQSSMKEEDLLQVSLAVCVVQNRME